ncbi:MAG: hypothetical protein EU532_10050 [Promethearchaeota archaeon]|nr:MAG: hypothetical protein EU532_10050 [Candidatus Lokiarchaeota archaeon]
MNGIYWIYILDNTGATIFSYENPIQANSRINSTLLSHFIYALQSVGKNLEQDEIKAVDLGNYKFFITKEKFTSYLFIIKTSTDIESKRINPILSNIRNKFIELFTGHFSLDLDEKVEILKSFEDYVKKIIEGKTHVNNLIEALSSD